MRTLYGSWITVYLTKTLLEGQDTAICLVLPGMVFLWHVNESPNWHPVEFTNSLPTASRRSLKLMVLTGWDTRVAGETAADSYRCMNSPQGHVGEKRPLFPFPTI